GSRPGSPRRTRRRPDRRDPQPAHRPHVSRDDLAFPGGTIHLISTTNCFSVSVPNCLANVTIQLTGEIVGGTGQFAAATGSFDGLWAGAISSQPGRQLRLRAKSAPRGGHVHGERNTVIPTPSAYAGARDASDDRSAHT